MSAEQKDTKGSHWLITINNPTPEDRIAVRSLPKVVKYHVGQDEIGEKTGTLHIQSYVYSDYVRFSQIKRWLPRAKILKADKPIAVEQYVQKLHTSVPDTRFEYGVKPKQAMAEQTEQITMMDNLVRLTGYRRPNDLRESMMADISGGKIKTPKQYAEEEYWRLVGRLIMDDNDLLSVYTQPNLRLAWINLSPTIYQIAAGRTDRNEIIPPENIEEDIITIDAPPSSPSRQ